MTNRRQFLCRTGGIMTAGATLGLAPVHAAAPDQTGVSDIPHDHYLLTDVLLETGVERDGDTVSPERSVYAVDLTRPVTTAELRARVRRWR